MCNRRKKISHFSEMMTSSISIFIANTSSVVDQLSGMMLARGYMGFDFFPCTVNRDDCDDLLRNREDYGRLDVYLFTFLW